MLIDQWTDCRMMEKSNRSFNFERFIWIVLVTIYVESQIVLFV